MRGLRDRLARLVVGWLVCQVALLAVPSVALCASLPHGVAIAVCTCSHSDGRPCPMHPAANKSKDSCSCRSSSETGSEAMASLFGPQAVLPETPSADVAVTMTECARRSVSSLPGWIAVPDGPPPRS